MLIIQAAAQMSAIQDSQGLRSRGTRESKVALSEEEAICKSIQQTQLFNLTREATLNSVGFRAPLASLKSQVLRKGS